MQAYKEYLYEGMLSLKECNKLRLSFELIYRLVCDVNEMVF